MIEVVFGDSACGSLKMAQHYGEGEYRPSCIGVIVSHTDGHKPTEQEIAAAQRAAEERERLRWENAVPMGSRASDVLGFPLGLSTGDISGDCLGERRRNEWLRLFYDDAEWLDYAQKQWDSAVQNRRTALERAAAGEDVRIWYSDNPDETCGLYWFLSQLRQLPDYSGQCYLVKRPAWVQDEDGALVQTVGWGDATPGDWHRSLSLQTVAPPLFCQQAASVWEALQRENAPLRAVLNGRLVSVPETLYDSFIVRELEAETGEFQEAQVVGRVLGKYRLGIGDDWIALRIDEMVRAGKYEVVAEGPGARPAYRRILKATDGPGSV